MKNIIAMLGTQEFLRLKMGVGEKPQGSDLVEHVLGRLSKEERPLVDEAISRAVLAAELIAAGETDRAMNEFNA